MAHAFLDHVARGAEHELRQIVAGFVRRFEAARCRRLRDARQIGIRADVGRPSGRDIDGHQPLDQLGMALREEHRNAPAERMSDQREAFELPLGDDRTQILVEVLQAVVLVRAPAAVAVTPLIDRNDMVAIVVAAAEIVPDVRMQTAAMHQNDVGTARIHPVEMMQAHGIANDEVAVGGNGRHGNRVRRLGMGDATLPARWRGSYTAGCCARRRPRT